VPKKSDLAPDTKLLLLEAAERLISIHGVKGTSLRQITEEAGVNVALVKYHFGSKGDLVAATLHRRLSPLNEKRLQLLTLVEAEHPTGELPLEKVLIALIKPVVDFGLQGGEGGRRFLKLFGRVFAEPAEAMQIIRKQMGPMIKRFDAAFARALPGIDEADMGWRKMASLGVVQHSLLMLSMLDELPIHLRVPIRLIKGVPKPDLVLAQLVAFCAAGMRASLAADP
jgi:AcrR family transcriptional regulator